LRQCVSFFEFEHQVGFVCRRPAVSTITASAPRAFAAAIASNTTAAGSEPDFLLDDCDAVALGQISSCSIAAARKVSAATQNHAAAVLAEAIGEFADAGSFAAPFTPTMKIHARVVAVCRSRQFGVFP